MYLTESDIKKLGYINLKKWHESGYTGKSIVIYELEYMTDHQQNVQQMIKAILPDAKIYTLVDADCYMSDIEGQLKFIDRIKPHAIGTSMMYSNLPQWQKLVDGIYDMGIPFFMSAGNEGDKITEDSLASLNKLIAVGSAKIEEGKIIRNNYSEYGQYLDFCGFTLYLLSGTSFARPFLMAQAGLLIEKVGRLNHKQIYSLLKKYANQKFDSEIGYGIVRLPNPEELEGDKMVEMVIGNKTYKVNGQDRTMDTSPFIKDNRTFVPIRFIAEALGFNISWDAKEQKVTITKEVVK